MADALISLLIENLGSMVFEKIMDEVGLITGVAEEIEKLKSTFLNIQAVLEDAEKRQHSDAAVGIWLEKLKDVSLDIDDVLDEWMTPSALQSKMEEAHGGDAKAVSVKKKVWLSLLSLCICSGGGTIEEVHTRYRIAQEIRDLNERLDKMSKDKDRFNLDTADHVDGASAASSHVRKITSSFVNEKEVRGRDTEKEFLVNKLQSGIRKSEPADKGFGIVSVVGIGGLGKTTLAQLAFNDDRIKNHFDSHIWVCVSDPFDEIRVSKAILEVLNDTARDSDELNHLVQKIHGLVEGKKFLLVLDDVWNESYDKWEELEKSLRNGAAGSMILVTTRKEIVSTTMRVAKRDMIVLENLSEEYCWLIFSQKAFFDRTEEECRRLEEIGREITKKSKGLPLIAKTLGGLMSYKKTVQQWNSVLNNELWELKAGQEIFAPFFLSYCDLLPVEKRCLLYCSIFPKDYVIEKDMLIRLWMSQGFFGCKTSLEEEGEACFENLAMRSFFQDFVKDEFDGSISNCKMHDIVCDFIKFMTKDEYCLLEAIEYEIVNREPYPFDEKLYHLTYLGSYMIFEECSKNKLEKISKLRTLFFISASRMYTEDCFFQLPRIRTLILRQLPSSLASIGKLIHLRYLDLSGYKIEELPDALCDLYNLQTLDLNCSHCEKLPENINKLENLRYLDLSGSYVRELPDSICNLSKLQTLKLNYCHHLQRIPERIGELVQLRHLELSRCLYLKGLPKGVMRLTNLHTLKLEMPIAKDTELYLNLEDLKSLRHVLNSQSYFALLRCTNIRNPSEARDIGIECMEYLAELHLSFEDFSDVEEEGMEDHRWEILEAFKPTPNLKSLVIQHYTGLTISPKWMISLINLTRLNLETCDRCSVLPPLGKLPSLERLCIESFRSLEMVGPEFLGIGYDTEERESCLTLFPKLKSLTFQWMPKWGSWVGTTNPNTVIMPCLTHLKFTGCLILKALPDFLPMATIRDLDIRISTFLAEKYYTTSEAA